MIDMSQTKRVFDKEFEKPRSRYFPFNKIAPKIVAHDWQLHLVKDRKCKIESCGWNYRGECRCPRH